MNIQKRKGAALTAVLVFCSLLPADDLRAESFSITLTNLTNTGPNNGQPFSPPVFVTHDATLSLWEAGQAATPGLALIAEEGVSDLLVTDLQTQLGAGVSGIATPSVSPLMPGQSLTFTVTTDATRPFLSSAWMLGRTNDGFTGNNALDLFGALAPGGYELFALDAGSEVNNESALFLPALGGTLNDPENGVVGIHTGIRGDADAPASWGFSGAVARVTVVVVPETGTLWLLGSGILTGLVLARRKRLAL